VILYLSISLSPFPIFHFSYINILKVEEVFLEVKNWQDRNSQSSVVGTTRGKKKKKVADIVGMK